MNQLPSKDSLTPEEAMALNRHERRRLGKLNALKIPGSTQPIVKDENKKRWALTTFTGKKK